MTPIARRLYSIFAFIVFGCTALIVVGWSNGYDIVGWKHGLVRTGALFISSEPKATLALNGSVIGQTPQRLSRLAPGIYNVTLKKIGYGDWMTTVRITSGVGQVLGPVYLYPKSFTVTDLSVPSPSSILTTDNNTAIYAVANEAPVWTVRQIWPLHTATYALPWAPTSVSISPDGQTVAFFNHDAAAIFSRTSVTPWTIPLLDNFTWDEQTSTLFYGTSGETVTRYDALTQTSTVVATATSFALVKDTLWYTTVADGETTVEKQSTFGQQTPVTIFQQPGAWSLINNPIGLLLKNSATREVLLLRPQNFSSLYASINLGLIDTLWWTNSAQPPLWLAGSDLWTLDEYDAPLLIDRFPTQLRAAVWLVTGHTLVISDGHELRIQSIGVQQGRGTLLSWSSLTTFSIVGIDIAKKTIVIRSEEDSKLQTVTW